MEIAVAPRQRTAVVLRTTLPVRNQTASDETEEAAIIPEDAAEGVLSELVREQGADGVETIRGWLLAEFAPGQRTAVAHVAFCPALGGQPQCEAEQVAGPPATVRVAQILPLGARIEARLDAPAQAATAVRIELAASGAAAADPND